MYVFENKTIQYTIPKGFKFVDQWGDEDLQLYALDTTGFSELDFDDLSMWPISKGAFHGLIPKLELGWNGMDFLAEQIEEILEIMGYGNLREEPIVSKRNGYPFLTAAFSYENEFVAFNQIHVSVIEFGDYLVVTGVFNLDKNDDGLMSYLNESIRKSITVVETDRENSIIYIDDFEDDLFFAARDRLHSSIDSDQLVFEKESSYYWNDAHSDYYTWMYDYGAPDASIQGSVMLFTAGEKTDSLNDQALFVKLVEQLYEYEIESIKKIGTVQGDHFTFKKYTVSGDENTNKFIKHIYTTTYNGELLVIIVKRGEYTTSNFTRYYEPFVKSLKAYDRTIER